MKFKFIYTIFSLSLLALVFISSKNGRADDAGQGNTGAPGDQTLAGNPRICASCHNSAAIQITTGIELLNDSGTAVTEYTPGATYRVRVTHDLAVGTPEGYGFQVLSLKAPLDMDGADVEGFSNPAPNVKIAVATANGRQYAEHNGISESNIFEVDWTAPDEGTGPVSFYTCGNGVNDNNETNGDGSACATLELAEADPSSIVETNGSVKIFLFPNPVQEEMKVQLISDVSAEFDMELYDMQGRLLITEQINFMAGENNYTYDVNSLPKGTYLVKFSNEDKIATAKLLKL